jgi:hypothetical protein
LIIFVVAKSNQRVSIVANQSHPFFIAVCVLAVVTLLFVGCSKKVVAPVTTAPEKTLRIEEIDFEYFQGKAKINFKDDKREREVKANIRIRKDSVIWMTFSVVGVQGGKALINRDSITVVSTLDKEYFVFTYEELSKRFNFPISYQVIQSAALGNLIKTRQPGDVVTTDLSFNLLAQTEGSISIRNYINMASSKLERVELKESQTQNTLNIEYSNFQVVGPKIFPYNGTISIFYKTVGGLISNTITFEYNKAEVGDKELKFPFNIPRKYDRR